MTKHLLSGHARFRADYFANEGNFLRQLANHGQSPSALYISCSDSRVVPELLTSSSPGELFVVRNIANFVPTLEHPDASVGAAVDYAVEVLRVPHIIVCGHDGCGGVRAVLDDVGKVAHLPSLHEWLTAMTSCATAARKLTNDKAELLRAAVEENVLDSLNNLLTYKCVATRIADGSITMHGWVFDIAEGALRVYDAKTEEFVQAERFTG
jgi:carbonic anhydrase